jgi:transcriptional regulator with PAS, ATPase and Fis domain
MANRPVPDAYWNRSDASPSPAFPYIVGRSARIREIYAVMEKVSQGDASVCIEGENGTGKELIARALHASGPRRDNPFVTLDCATIPEGLMESQLFGHVRGAFTGASSTRPGVFAQAHTGTIFIDEIGELPLHLQAKLLRVIQTREFTMVGGNHPHRVDVRIITATNRDLHQAVCRGTFREDLYYRIAVVHLHLPPLRERKDDIPLLVAHFLRKLAPEYHKEICGLTTRAMDALMAFSWPGNIRQLANSMEQAIILADGEVVDLEHFPSLLRDGALSSVTSRATLREVEKQHILETLRRSQGNRARTASQLGISLRGLQYKLKRYAEEDGDVEPPPSAGAGWRASRVNGAVNGAMNGTVNGSGPSEFDHRGLSRAAGAGRRAG